jgi:probable rRNA maturation factor
VSIEVTNESSLEVDLDRVVKLAEYVRNQLRLHPAIDLGVIFVDEPVMADLHVKWLDEPGPTDVLSFPMDELRPGALDEEPREGVLGDVVICPQVASQQAIAAGHNTSDEILLLLAHGMLHLVGFDHAEPEEEAEMFGLQRDLLKGFAAHEGNS